MNTQEIYNKIYLKWDSMMEIVNKVCDTNGMLSSYDNDFTPYEYLIIFILFTNMIEGINDIINSIDNDNNVKNILKNQKKFMNKNILENQKKFMNKNTEYIQLMLTTKFNDEVKKYSDMKSKIFEENIIYHCMLLEKKGICI